MTKIFFVLLFIGLNSISLNAQDYKKQFFDFYVHTEMDKWKNLMLELENKQNINEELLKEIINYQYGFIAYCIGNDRKEEADNVLERARKNLTILSRNPNNKALVYAYKSAFIGYDIGISPYKAPFIGQKSIDFAEMALEADSTLFNSQMESGNLLFYMPEFFGGSKKAALKHYLLAEKYFVNSVDFEPYDWNYINLLTQIGQAYQKTGQYNLSRKYYNQVLALAPEFKFIKEELIPSLP